MNKRTTVRTMIWAGLTASLTAVLIIVHLVGIPVASACDLPSYLRQQQRLREEEAAAAQATANREFEIVILHDVSLDRPFFRLARLFETQNPDIRVRRESAGGRLVAHQLVELGKQADIMVVTDFHLIQQHLMPDHADWFVAFATNEIVLAYTPHGAYRDQITSENWFEILLRDDVSFGYACPHINPIGYRTLLTWKLTDLLLGEPAQATTPTGATTTPTGATSTTTGATSTTTPPPTTDTTTTAPTNSVFHRMLAASQAHHITPSTVNLIPLLHDETLDYIFLYRSVAEQHNLQYLRLPDEVNLSSLSRHEEYGRASLDLSQVPRTTPGVTVTPDPPSPDTPSAGTPSGPSRPDDDTATSSTITGSPIVYAFTIPNSARNRRTARKFADLLVGSMGSNVLGHLHLPVIHGGRTGFSENAAPSFE